MRYAYADANASADVYAHAYADDVYDAHADAYAYDADVNEEEDYE